MSELILNTPSVLLSLNNPIRVSKKTVEQVVAALMNSRHVLLDTSFFDGRTIVEAVERSVHPPPSTASYSKRKAHERAIRAYTKNLFVQTTYSKNKEPTLHLEGVSIQHVMTTLYPEGKNGFLSFLDVQEMAGAEQRMDTGIHYPVIGKRLHPFFGVYYPSRTEHLELFATWLSQYTGPKTHATDVGTGSGILSFMLAKSGIAHITATDQNPNAIWSVANDSTALKMTTIITPIHTDLLINTPTTALIVFNPPWIPGESHSAVGDALFFDKGLFSRFFDQAATHLEPNGKIVILFSTILSLLRPDLPHPIERELQRGRFKLVNKTKRKVKPTNGRRSKERVEVWELAFNHTEH